MRHINQSQQIKLIWLSTQMNHIYWKAKPIKHKKYKMHTNFKTIRETLTLTGYLMILWSEGINYFLNLDVMMVLWLWFIKKESLSFRQTCWNFHKGNMMFEICFKMIQGREWERIWWARLTLCGKLLKLVVNTSGSFFYSLYFWICLKFS